MTLNVLITLSFSALVFGFLCSVSTHTHVLWVHFCLGNEINFQHKAALHLHGETRVRRTQHMAHTHSLNRLYAPLAAALCIAPNMQVFANVSIFEQLPV